MENSFKESFEIIVKKVSSTRQSFCSRFSKLEKNIFAPLNRLEHILDQLFSKTNHMIITSTEEFKNINQLINSINDKNKNPKLQ